MGSIDIYPELYALATSLTRADWSGAGIQMGPLLAQLRASGCHSHACTVIEGIMAALQVGLESPLANSHACHESLDQTWAHMEQLESALKNHKWQQVADDLSIVLSDFS